MPPALCGRARPSSPQAMSAFPGSARRSCRLGQHQIVAVNDLVASTIAEDRRDFTALMPSDAVDVAARIGGKPAPRLDSSLGADDHTVAAFESTLDRHDPGRQQALALAKRFRRAVIDNNNAGGVDRAGDPRFPSRARL